VYKLLFCIVNHAVCFHSLYTICACGVVAGLLAMSTLNSYFYAAVVTIVAVHVFLALFIYTAIADSTRPTTVHKID